MCLSIKAPAEMRGKDFCLASMTAKESQIEEQYMNWKSASTLNTSGACLLKCLEQWERIPDQVWVFAVLCVFYPTSTFLESDWVNRLGCLGM